MYVEVFPGGRSCRWRFGRFGRMLFSYPPAFPLSVRTPPYIKVSLSDKSTIIQLTMRSRRMVGFPLARGEQSDPRTAENADCAGERRG